MTSTKNSNITKYALVFGTFIVSIGLDQWTKWLAVSTLKGQAPIIYLDDLFRLEYAENTGAMLSMGGQLSEEIKFLIFTVAIGIMLIAGLIFILIKPLNQMTLIGSSLIISGGLGNVIDRVLNNGAVVDFMNIGIGSLRTGIFNVADIAIMLGLGFMILASFQKEESVQ